MMHEINHFYMHSLANAPECQGKSFVVGEGETASPVLMLIGEAPGRDEVLQGRPFVGKAGQNLSKFLEVIEVSRESIYITNVVKIRPTLAGKSSRERNRPPTMKEVELFNPWLLEEIRHIQPKVLVTLGNTPLKSLMGKEASIGGMHGLPIDSPFGIKLFPLYHPAAIIYNRALSAVYDNDLSQLRLFLNQILL